MAQLGEVVFALERFEWSDDARLEVVGRWEGLQGRRMGRPALTIVESGGRRRRLNALPGGQLSGDQPWRASFACDGGTVAVERAELELGRRLVVELPPPRRRRRRPTPPPPRTTTNGTADIPSAPAADGAGQRAELEAARAERDGLAAELATATAERDGLAAELATATAERDGLDGKLSTARAERDSLSAQLASLRAERDNVTAELTTVGAARDDVSTELGNLRAERDELAAQLRSTRDALAEREQRLLGAESDAVRAEDDASSRLDAERAETADLRTRLAAAREEAEQARTEAAGAIAAEAQETERLRGELTAAREESEDAIAAARAEAATLREQFAEGAPAHGSAGTGEGADPAARRLLESVTRDLERERATVRTLRREVEALQAETAEQRRAAAVAGATASIEPGPDSRLAARAHRVDVARNAGAVLVPAHRRSMVELWGARIVAALFVGLLLLALALIVTPLL